MSEAVLTGLYVQHYTRTAGFSLLFYDYFVTLSSEVQFVWQAPKSRSFFLFLWNRYPPLFLVLASVIMEFMPELSSTTCRNLDRFRLACYFVIPLPISVISSLRIYAVYGCRRTMRFAFVGWHLVFIIFAGLMTFWPQRSDAIGATVVQDAPYCLVINEPEMYTRATIIMGIVVIYELSLLCLLVHHSYTQRKGCIGESSNRLASVILRDGIAYFFTIVLALALDVFTYWAFDVYYKGCLLTITLSVGTTAVSRLCLNLHEASQDGILSTSHADSDHLSSIRFHVSMDTSQRSDERDFDVA